MNRIAIAKRVVAALPFTERMFPPLRHYVHPVICEHPPGTLYCEPTNCCNLRCAMCPQHASPRKKGFMELSLFRKIVNELPDRIFVQLFFGGESLMHPEIVPMISFLHQHKPKVQVRIATNGTLLDTDLARDLILSGLDYISFSFDGPDRETYESIRRGAKYEETLENILNFTRLRRELDSKTPQVNVEIISMKATEAKLEQFIQYFKRLPIDAIFVKRFSHWAGLIERDADDGDSTSRVVCPVPWNDLGILWDGTVVPCCTDYNARYPVGNVSNDRLADLWNNDRMKALRRSLASYHYYEIPLCAHCKDIEAITSAHSRSITPASTG